LKVYIDRVNRSDLYILLIGAANGIMKLIRCELLMIAIRTIGE